MWLTREHHQYLFQWFQVKPIFLCHVSYMVIKDSCYAQVNISVSFRIVIRVWHYRKMACGFVEKRMMENDQNESEKDYVDSYDRSDLQKEYGKSNATSQNNLKLLSVSYHFVMTIFCLLLVYHSTVVVTKGMSILDPNGIIPPTGGYFKFLSHINQWLQLLFFSVQSLTNILHIRRSKMWCSFQKICDIFFTTIIVPTSLFVTLLFWSIYAYDRNLVYPEVFDLVVPQSTNHFWHTTVLLWVVFETILCFHRYPSVVLAVGINFTFNAIYLSWAIWIFIDSGYWVYPILYVLPLHYQILFCFGCILLSLLLYFIGQAFARFRWGKILYIE